MKCLNCYGFGYVKILNEADEVVEMECPVCKGLVEENVVEINKGSI